MFSVLASMGCKMQEPFVKVVVAKKSRYNFVRYTCWSYYLIEKVVSFLWQMKILTYNNIHHRLMLSKPRPFVLYPHKFKCYQQTQKTAEQQRTVSISFNAGDFHLFFIDKATRISHTHHLKTLPRFILFILMFTKHMTLSHLPVSKQV